MTSDPRSEALLFLRQVAEGEPEVVLDPIQHDLTEAVVTEGSVTLSPDFEERRSRLEAVGKIAAVCTLCELAKTRNKVVFGVGSPVARLMFVGEAPGADEDRIGEPFVGRAGQLLTRIIIAMGMSRREVYIANILKCRPPNNRNPLPNESSSCKPYLRQQLDIIRPELIVALGLVAATNLLNLPPTTAVKDLRGRILDFEGRPLIVTYHPAALLRNPALRAPTWQDMQKVMGLLNGTIRWEGSKEMSLV